MASWTHQPDNWAEVAQPGVDQEMKNFPDYIGHTNEACAAYRDFRCSLSCSSSTASFEPLPARRKSERRRTIWN